MQCRSRDKLSKHVPNIVTAAAIQQVQQLQKPGNSKKLYNLFSKLESRPTKKVQTFAKDNDYTLCPEKKSPRYSTCISLKIPVDCDSERISKID